MLHSIVDRRHLISKGVELAFVQVAEFFLETIAQAKPYFLAHGGLDRILSALIVDFVHLGSKPHLVMVLVILNFILISIGSILLSSSLMI